MSGMVAPRLTRPSRNPLARAREAATLWDLPHLGDPTRATPASGPRTTTRFGVIASSSSGNCSVLITGEGRTKRVTLIDCGLSPRRVKAYLAEHHLGLERIDDVVLTHLDTDHCHAGWKRALPAHARFRIHRRHLGRAERSGLLYRRTEVFDDALELPTGVRASVVHASHDAEGVAVFRFEVPPEEGFAHGASLGYATDLGRLTPSVVDLLRGVDVLAIESNYCPHLQELSGRPAMLKHRIMGGSGHLSNEESAEAVRLIKPRRKVVLLHLSRECNTPDVAGARHGASPCHVVISDFARPTPLIRL